MVLAFSRPFFFLASGCGLYGKFFCLVCRYQNLIFPSPLPFLREVDASSIITILWIFYSSVSCSGYFGLAVYFIPHPSPLSPPLSVIFIFLHIRNHLRVLGTYLVHIIEIISLPKGKLHIKPWLFLINYIFNCYERCVRNSLFLQSGCSRHGLQQWNAEATAESQPQWSCRGMVRKGEARQGHEALVSSYRLKQQHCDRVTIIGLWGL